MQEYAANSSTRQCVNDVDRVIVGRFCVTPVHSARSVAIVSGWSRHSHTLVPTCYNARS